jgi:hypothetical protein
MEYTYQPLSLRSKRPRKLPKPFELGHGGILFDWKESSQELLGQHRAEEQTTGLLCEAAIGRISVMCLRGVAVTARCPIQFGKYWWEWTRSGVG